MSFQYYSSSGVSFPNGFPRVDGAYSPRRLVPQTNSARHIQPTYAPASPERVTEGFADALGEALRRVEGLDNQSQSLTQQAIYAPDSVEVHEVVVAAEKARFALNLTKTVSDGFVRTFRELTSPR